MAAKTDFIAGAHTYTRTPQIHHHQMQHAGLDMRTHRTFASYLLIFIVAMLVSMLAKRASHTAKLGRAGAISASRYFMFSSKSSNSASGKAESGWTSDGGSAAGGNPVSSAASSSAAYNYDKASFDKLVLYNIAVAFQAKNRQELNIFKKKQGKSAAQLLPLGEDNLFVSAQSEDGYLALGVADGVGGWSEAGYDLSAILRELCHLLKLHFENAQDKSGVTPRALLGKAFDDVMLSPKVEIGGTTACLGVLTPDKKLLVANLGDSWCGLFRDYKLVKETLFQTHNFNTPFQLAKIPKQILRQAELQGKRYIIDSPQMCDEYVWDLQKDDVIMFATDGVTDNVVPQDIEIFLKDQLSANNKFSDVSDRFVQEVVKVSKDANFPSAFAQELSRLTGQRYLGGKEDDITVVMVRVL